MYYYVFMPKINKLIIIIIIIRLVSKKSKHLSGLLIK